MRVGPLITLATLLVLARRALSRRQGLQALLLVTLTLSVQAEDIDLYTATPANAGRPNVLFVLDNAANFSANAANCTYVDGTAPTLNGTAGGIEQCALYNVVSGLPVGSDGSGVVNIGLMAYNANNMRDIQGANCGDSNGGCLMVPLMEMNATNRAAFLAWVKSWRTTGGAGSGYIKANGEATGAAMQEAWAYYAGRTGLSGRAYAGVSPAAGCQKNFVVFIGNAFNNSGTPGDGGSASPATALASAPGITASLLNAITIPSGNYGAGSFSCGSYTMPNHASSSGLYADEWARYMYQSDLYSSLSENQGITTYTIGLLGAACKPDFPALLASMAKYGGGKYYATSSYSEIATALQNILNEVQSVNSVFTSASLPVSVNAQGTYLNQVFLGMFRPEASAAPRWLGNLKQYQFVLDPATGALQLGDSTGAPALSSAGTGFIGANAISFWSGNAGGPSGGFFVNDPKGAGGAFDSPDGEFVDKGGAAQVQRNALLSVNYASSPTAPRRLYTYCPAGSGCAARLSDSTNAFSTVNSALTTALLGVTDSSARVALINWVRGEDNQGGELGPGGTVNVRPSLHGDVLHSRPAVINYGDSRGLVVYYGTNDGVFRAVNGSQSGSQSGSLGTVPAGGELWGLVLPEHYTRLKRQRDNAPELRFPGTLGSTAQAKDYFVDGSPGLYQKLRADGSVERAILFLVMRRGGRFLYALDVTEPTDPQVLWRISASDSGYAELGQTWSRPRVTLVRGYANPVLVFGAGYDPAQDAEPPAGDSMGRGIFVLDALSGAQVWRATPATSGGTVCSGTSTQAACAVAGMAWAVAADIAFVDRDNDGYTERLYAVDLGGNVWRIDLEPTGGNTPNAWQVTPLAALGCAGGSCAAGITPRKFFYPPSVVFVGASGATSSFDAVMVGSGDREHPLLGSEASSVANRFYVLKDRHTGKDARATPLQPMITESAGLSGGTSPGLVDATSTPYDGSVEGYYIRLGAAEKVVNAPTTVRGVTFFGTNQPVAPSANSCAPNLGLARGYALSPFSASRGVSVYDGGGLPPSPVAGVVTVAVSGRQVQESFCIGCGGLDSAVGGDTRSALGAGNTAKIVAKRPRRTYWYRR